MRERLYFQVSTVTAGPDPRGYQWSEDPTKAPERRSQTPPPPLRATIMYLLLKIVRVLNVTDERNDSSNQRVCTSSIGHNLSVVKVMSVPQARDMKGTGNKLVIFGK